MSDDCRLCQGTGEVEIDIGVERQTFGCPLCIEHEKNEEIAGLNRAIKLQASAAKSGMDAAHKISAIQLDMARRLKAESSPEALESERAMNAKLTDELAELQEKAANWDALINCARITAMGSAGLEPSPKSVLVKQPVWPDNYGHMTLNFWTKGEREQEEYPRRWLKRFVELARACK